MIQVIAAVLSVLLGVIVVLFGQERRVKPWFALLCLSCVALTLGHLVETTSLEYAFPAARVVMTAAVVAALAGAMSAQIMCGMKPSRPVFVLVAVAALINIVTVVLTDWYFTGGIVRYSWGHFVAGKIEFIANPLSVSAIATYALGALLLHYRRAHPLDRNRIGFFFIAYSFLSMTLFDYLPHFGIDLFGGLVSGISIPLFLGAFGYASLRYRLIEFRVFLSRAAGYVLVAITLVCAYAAFMEIGRRMGIEAAQLGIGAAILVLAIFASLGRLVPRLLEKAARRREPDYQKAIEVFSSDLMKVLDEKLLSDKVSELCIVEFFCSTASLLGEGEVASDGQLSRIAIEGPVVETEIVRRQQGGDSELLRAFELIVPLFQRTHLIGALALGRRADGKIYTRMALQGFHTLGNLVSMALVNTRAALELQKRHQLDRYLAPQLVESVLSGGAELIEKKQRIPVTVFFSDLKDFTGMSDRMDPEGLAVILNEYLSEMAEIAFAYGGTVDKFIGDAVMVLFGAPIGNDASLQARQCVRMAIEMQRRLRDLNARWIAGGLLYRGLSCRIGIHTGVAIVGSFGSVSRVDYTAIGSTVNLASRLEGKCAPGMLLVSADTRELLGDEFRIARREPVEVKGFSRPVEVYEIDPGFMTNKSIPDA